MGSKSKRRRIRNMGFQSKQKQTDFSVCLICKKSCGSKYWRMGIYIPNDNPTEIQQYSLCDRCDALPSQERLARVEAILHPDPRWQHFDEKEQELLLEAKSIGIDVLTLYGLVDQLDWVYGGDEPILLVNPWERPATVEQLREFDRKICAAGITSFVRRRYDFEEFMKGPDAPADVQLPDHVLVEEVSPGYRTRRPFEVLVKTIEQQEPHEKGSGF